MNPESAPLNIAGLITEAKNRIFESSPTESKAELLDLNRILLIQYECTRGRIRYLIENGTITGNEIGDQMSKVNTALADDPEYNDPRFSMK